MRRGAKLLPNLPRKILKIKPAPNESDERRKTWEREAQQYRLLDPATIKDLLAMFRIVAQDSDRAPIERERAQALVRLLGSQKD